MTSGGEWLRDEDVTEVAGRVADVTKAGLPLESGLRALAEEAPSRRLRRALVHLTQRLDAGEPFEAVFAAEGPGLPGHLQRLIQAGLHTGRLGLLMEEYVEHVRRRADRRWQIVMSLVYPLLLTLLALIVVTFLLAGIVPDFKDIFEDFGMALPGVTLVLVSLSDLVVRHGVWVLAGVLVLGGGMWLGMTFWGGKPFRRRLFCIVPLVGPLFRSAALAGFFRLLAMLVENGVPLPDALRMAGQGANDADLRQTCDQLADDVQQGVTLDVAVVGRRQFPPSLQHVFHWSARRGAFPEALRAASDILESQTRIQAEAMALVCEPLILILLATCVGFVILGLFMPLIKLLNELS